MYKCDQYVKVYGKGQICFKGRNYGSLPRVTCNFAQTLVICDKTFLSVHQDRYDHKSQHTLGTKIGVKSGFENSVPENVEIYRSSKNPC